MAKKRHAISGLVIIALATFLTTLLWLLWMNASGSDIFSPSNTTKNPSAPSTLGKDQKFSEWTEVAPGVEFRDVERTHNSKPVVFHLIKLNPAQLEMSIAHEADGKSLRTWLGEEEGIIINAGFFKQENAPVGLLYINGQRVDDHRIRPQGTGILEIIGKEVNVFPLTPEMSTQPLEVDFALQSFPLLIVDGQVNELTASSDIDRRTAVGMGKDQQIYLVTIDEPVYSLEDFAQALMDVGVGWENVLNLDGGSSTGVIAHYGDFFRLIDTQTFVPTVIRVH